MDIKSKAASGENVSRSLIKSLIDSFLAHNKTLKLQEQDMTAAQRHRFAAIGRWFATGERPEPVPASLPQSDSLLPGPVVAVPFEMLEIDARRHVPGSDGAVPELQSNKLRGDVYILAILAAPDMCYGLMVGYIPRRVGAYACFRSSFVSAKSSYSCNYDGVMSSGGSIWPSGQQRRSNLAVTAGALVGATDWLAFNAGLGYGYRRLAWEDIDGQWALVSDWSHSGVAAELGTIVSIRKVAISAGVSTVAFRTAAFTCGVGVRF